jgi:predicted GIY-YIG superfamily endonuclease
MAFSYTYVLKCSDGDMYIGSTDDLKRRIADGFPGAGAAGEGCGAT